VPGDGFARGWEISGRPSKQRDDAPRSVRAFAPLPSRRQGSAPPAGDAPANSWTMRPVASRAFDPLDQPAARISAAWRSSSCAIMCRPPGNACLAAIAANRAPLLCHLAPLRHHPHEIDAPRSIDVADVRHPVRDHADVFGRHSGAIVRCAFCILAEEIGK
jgi:hypothetical protein